MGIFSGGLQQVNYLLCPALAVASAQTPTEGRTAAAGIEEAAEAAEAAWPWYCHQENLAARVLQRMFVAWLPTLLLSLWQGMVLPVTNWLLIQVRYTAGGGKGAGTSIGLQSINSLDFFKLVLLLPASRSLFLLPCTAIIPASLLSVTVTSWLNV